MFRPSADLAAPAERSLTVTLALAGQAVATARVRALTGAQELRLSEARDRLPSAAFVRLETLALCEAVSDIAGRAPTPEQMDALLLGDRNRLMLAALCVGYEPPKALLMTCQAEGCGAHQEAPFDQALFLDARSNVSPQEPICVEMNDGAFELSLPTGADLAAISADGRADAWALLRQCAPDAPSSADALAAAETTISACDPCAEIVLSSCCMECGAEMTGRLDPLALLWTEMDRYGGVLYELDRLARVYHWSEAELLALPAYRRRRYLSIVEEADYTAVERRAS